MGDDGTAVHTGLARARNLLDGLIAYRAELGDLGRELEDLLRAAGVEPSEGPVSESGAAPPTPDLERP